MKYYVLPLALSVMVACLPGTVSAEGLDDYILNFSAAADADGAAPVADLPNVDEWQFLAQSYLGFTDGGAGGAGVISIGDTFTDFTAVRITGFTNSPAMGTMDITPANYGGGPGGTHELTVLLQFNGTQTGVNAYSVDAISQFDIFFDGVNAGGGGFTPTSFADISTFADGALVETAALIVGGGVNFDPVLPNGTISLILNLFDNLNTLPGSNNEEFELAANGDPLSSLFDVVLGVVDANNLVDDGILVSALEAFYGFDGGIAQGGGLFLGGDFDFGFSTESDGSFNKQAVPEPAPIVLLGLGLLVAFRRAQLKK